MASFFNVPPFHDTKSRYDMTEFKGRSWFFYRSCNPQLMFETDASIADHKQRIEEWRKLSNSAKQNMTKHQNRDLWYSRSVVDGCVHPTTGQTIFPAFRFAAFAPINLLIVPVMLAPSTIASKPRTIAVHWFNQSLNSMNNYANRSSDDVSVTKLLSAYGAAVVSSCTLALGASAVMSRITDANSMKATLVRSTLPFAAVVTAGFCNLSLMRFEEWTSKGVPVRAAAGPPGTLENDNNKGEVLGYSLNAGREGLMYCALSRIALNFNVMMFPPLFMALLLRNATLAKSPMLARNVELAVISVMTLGAVPPSLALMKPVLTVPVASLEENFQKMTDKNGNPIENVTFYKGL